jgi:hypothetical protein
MQSNAFCNIAVIKFIINLVQKNVPIKISIHVNLFKYLIIFNILIHERLSFLNPNNDSPVNFIKNAQNSFGIDILFLTFFKHYKVSLHRKNYKFTSSV